MPSRGYQDAGYSKYRWGFNGQEKDEETETSHFKFRENNEEIGRFWSVDPLTSQYPWNSPYAFAENRVIDGIDLEGAEWWGVLFRVGLANNSKPVVRPVTETIVRTNIPRPKWNPEKSWFDNIVDYFTFGRKVHNEQLAKWQQEGWQIEHYLNNANRIDGFKRVGDVGYLRELKPNSIGGRLRGLQQLKRYTNVAKKEYPEVKKWVRDLYLYEAKFVGLFVVIDDSNNNIETLSKKYGISVETIKTINNINEKDNLIGREILLDIFIYTNSNSYGNHTSNSQDNTRVEIRIKPTKEQSEKEKKRREYLSDPNRL